MPAAPPRDVRIRPAAPRDAGALADLMRALHRHLKEPDAHISAAALRRDVLTGDSALGVLVAERGGILAGYALFHDTYESVYAQRGLYMADLFVTPDARRSGIGRALVAGVARAAHARGAKFLWWVSEGWDERAQAFYAALGASRDEVVAHALTFDAFSGLAEEGGARAS